MSLKPPTLDKGAETVADTEDTSTHGATNLAQVAKHVQVLEDIMNQMEAKAKENEVQDIIREALKEIKTKTAEMLPHLQCGLMVKMFVCQVESSRFESHQRKSFG